VAAIFVDQGRDKRWPPQFTKAVARIGRRQAVIARIDKDGLPIAANANVMRIQLTGKMRFTGDIAGINMPFENLVSLDRFL
jgi:hypothetical protein